jgi:hypothetical protein
MQCDIIHFIRPTACTYNYICIIFIDYVNPLIYVCICHASCWFYKINYLLLFHTIAVNQEWSLLLYYLISVLVSLFGSQRVHSVVWVTQSHIHLFSWTLGQQKAWMRKETLCPTPSVLQVRFLTVKYIVLVSPVVVTAMFT